MDRAVTDPQCIKPLLSVLQGQPTSPPPIWLMRQAGRYLPEYRELRAKAGSFLDLCYAPAMAAEVTLQPMRRFAFDAAILFSDILVVPHALGQKLEFREGEGPVLDPISERAGFTKLNREGFLERLSPIFETVDRVKSGLEDNQILIGFSGAPWTVATYMIAGKGTPDQAPARAFAYGDPEGFAELIDLLVDVSVDYLSAQVSAGAQVLQIFDSWAAVLSDDAFETWSIKPIGEMVRRLKALHPEIPIIGFPRGAGPGYVRFAEETGVDAVGCDTMLPLRWIRENLQPKVAVQGNLDPLLLVAGGEAMRTRVRKILSELGDGRHIFNLGHGIVPSTPPEHVGELVRLVREGAG